MQTWSFSSLPSQDADTLWHCIQHSLHLVEQRTVSPTLLLYSLEVIMFISFVSCLDLAISFLPCSWSLSWLSVLYQASIWSTLIYFQGLAFRRLSSLLTSGCKVQDDGVGGVGLSQGLSPWLADDHLASVSSHGLFFMFALGVCVSKFPLLVRKWVRLY